MRYGSKPLNQRLIDYQDVHNVPQYRVEQVRPPQAFLGYLFERFQFSQNRFGGQCATFVRTALGLPLLGDAKHWKPNAYTPIVGGAVIFDYNHVALVTGMIGDYLIIVESNYSGDGRIDVGRAVKASDPTIIGYVAPGPLASTGGSSRP